MGTASRYRAPSAINVATLALRNTYPVSKRKWGMRITVTNDATAANNVTWVLVYNLSTTNKLDNGNWQKESDYNDTKRQVNTLIKEIVLTQISGATTANGEAVAALADGEAITIILTVAGKLDSANTGFGGQLISTWTRAGGVLQLVGETGGSLSNNDTGFPITASIQSDGTNLTPRVSIGGGGGNCSWAWFVKTLTRTAN